MRAMILCAGKGERMRPLTDKLPKPLLKIGDKPILQYHIEALSSAGVKQIVINHARMGQQIEDYFGSGDEFAVSIEYSREGDEPLETGGGIRKALPLLGGEAFIVVNGDICCDYDFSRLPHQPESKVHLVLVPNPPHNSSGDFSLNQGRLLNEGKDRYTFSGIGVYRPELFEQSEEGYFPLAPLLRMAADKGEASAELHQGIWLDIGTPERLNQANKDLLRK